MTYLPSVDAIRDAVARRQVWGVRALQTLIAIDSISPGEAPCQQAFAELLRAEGLPAELLPLDDGTLRTTDGFIDSGLPLDNRPNLVTYAGGRGSGRSLVMNSHIDTVAWAETADRWDDHPLSGVVRDGRLYGRGAMDAKGQVMAAVVAVLALRDLGYEPKGRVIIHSAVSEEPEGNGTLALCAQGWTADAAINLEATENHVACGLRGVIGLRYLLAGEARHASVRGGQTNLIVRAGRLAAALDGSLDGWSDPTDAVYGKPTVNVGRIEGGEDIYTTPHRVTFECGIRYAPGTYDRLLAHIGAAVDGEFDGLPSVREAVFAHVDAASIPADSELATLFLDCANTMDAGRRLTVFPAGCDARHLINRYGVPTVVFGPGRLSLAHGVNEYLDLTQWQRASEILALFVTKWCG